MGDMRQRPGGVIVAGYASWDHEGARASVSAKSREQGAMLPILHDLQAQFGFIHEEAIALIAEALNVTKAETVGVISFYHDFRRAPAGRPVLKICRAESCQAAGCEALVDHLATRHGLVADAHGGGGAVEVETIYCLGHCAASPAAMFEGEPLAALTPARLDQLLRGVVGR
jgi:formate dehydrogenase subunit gamma